jgi:hypothetical protein
MARQFRRERGMSGVRLHARSQALRVGPTRLVEAAGEALRELHAAAFGLKRGRPVPQRQTKRNKRAWQRCS